MVINPMPSKSKPLISIIVAVFNGAKTLQQCIDSVANQTYQNKELIIIDGGSRDGTVDLLNSNQEQINYWISESDKGIYNAWNKGLEQVKGEWVCFLGADDFFWDDQVLEQVSAQLEKLPLDIRVAYGQVMLLNKNGENLYPVGEPWERISTRFKQIMSIPHQAVMHRRSLFERHGKFDESFRIAGDYELLMRELKMTEAFFVPGIVISGMRQGGISSSPENSLVLLRECRRVHLMNGHRLPKGVLLMAFARVHIRLILWRIFGERLARIIIDVGRRIRGLPPYWTKT